jgi:hypothetical protein
VAHCELDQAIRGRHAHALVHVQLFDHRRVLEHQLFVGGDELARAFVGGAGHGLEGVGADAGHAQERGDHLVLVRVGAAEFGDHAARQVRGQGTLQDGRGELAQGGASDFGQLWIFAAGQH